jgi:hypothetical protein
MHFALTVLRKSCMIAQPWSCGQGKASLPELLGVVRGDSGVSKEVREFGSITVRRTEPMSGLILPCLTSREK